MAPSSHVLCRKESQDMLRSQTSTARHESRSSQSGESLAEGPYSRLSDVFQIKHQMIIAVSCYAKYTEPKAREKDQ